jgi:uncharacterized protein DUF559
MLTMESEGYDKSGIYGRFRRTPAIDAEIARVVTPRYAVISIAQLRDIGLTDSAIHKRAASSRLYRVHQGVYALVPRKLLSREGLWLATVLSCGPGAVLCHQSGAALHELRPSSNPRIDVLVARRIHHRPGLRIHTSATLTPADITTVRGIPCTTVARTLLDLADVLPRRAVERACDQAETLQTFDLSALQEQIARHGTRRGAAVLQAILDEHYIGRTPTWSVLEERFLALSRAAGLPDPEVNAFIDPGDGEPAIRVDFAWRQRRLAVEADGRETHLTHQAFERDRRRDQRVTAAGWRIVRSTWRQIRDTPAQLQHTLRTLYRLANP